MVFFTHLVLFPKTDYEVERLRVAHKCHISATTVKKPLMLLPYRRISRFIDAMSDKFFRAFSLSGNVPAPC